MFSRFFLSLLLLKSEIKLSSLLNVVLYTILNEGIEWFLYVRINRNIYIDTQVHIKAILQKEKVKNN